MAVQLRKENKTERKIMGTKPHKIRKPEQGKIIQYIMWGGRVKKYVMNISKLARGEPPDSEKDWVVKGGEKRYRTEVGDEPNPRHGGGGGFMQKKKKNVRRLTQKRGPTSGVEKGGGVKKQKKNEPSF